MSATGAVSARHRDVMLLFPESRALKLQGDSFKNCPTGGKWRQSSAKNTEISSG